ncbi:MAG: ParA family protein [Calditrichia bacterium]
MMEKSGYIRVEKKQTQEWVDKMTKVISISNPKGGVGKTTTAINLAASLCIAEKKVLIIDMDTNGAVSIGLGLESDEINAGVMEIFLGARELPETIHVTPIPGLDIIPCNVRTLEQENRMNTITKNRKLLSRKMQDAVTKDKIHYDYIIIDTPPALNDITMSALYASDSVVIPLQCGYFSLNIIHRLLELIHRIRSSANPELAVEGILLNFYEKTTRTSQRTIEEARRLFKNQLFKTVIPKNAAISFAYRRCWRRAWPSTGGRGTTGP